MQPAKLSDQIKVHRNFLKKIKKSDNTFILKNQKQLAHILDFIKDNSKIRFQINLQGKIVCGSDRNFGAT